jgi:hypothetical protein
LNVSKGSRPFCWYNLNMLPVRKRILFVTLSFFASRAYAYFAGVRFDVISLTRFSQIIDPPLLRDDLWRSLWYLHCQPPLFNLFVGSILKLGGLPIVFALSFHLLGLLMAIVLYLTLEELQVSAPLCFLFTLVFILTPACILYENWLFYTYPVTGFLTFSVYFLQRLLKAGNFLDYFFFASSLSIVVLSLSFFHPAWLAVIFCVLLLIRKNEWKRSLAGISIPVLVVVLVFGKNYFLFGSFTGSTWFGGNISRISTFQIFLKERRILVAKGILSPLSLIVPFSDPSEYDPFLMQTRGSTDFPSHNAAVLDSRNKSNGIVNYNWIGYIDICRIYGQDARYVILHDFPAYRKGILNAAAIYFLPTSNHHRLDSNRKYIALLNHFYDRWIYGALFAKEDPVKMRWKIRFRGRQENLERSWFLIIGYPMLFLYGIWLCFQKGQPGPRWVFAFICFTIAYVTVVGICFEIGENNRFRFALESYFIILLAVLTDRLVKFARRKALHSTCDMDQTATSPNPSP